MTCNHIFKKFLTKFFTPYIQIMEPKEGVLDSMNMDSEYEEEGPFVKNGSYTDNEYLGHSHGQDTIGSIHNIFVDPTSEVFLEERKRELAFRKPSFVPDLDFDQLNRLDLKKAVRLKAFGVNKKLLHQSKSQKINHTQSNRIPGERISFTLEGYENDSASETCEKVSNSIEMEERKNPKFKSSKLHAHSHIMVKDVHNVSSNLNEHSQHFSGNISKIQNSCFASSSEATKKKGIGPSNCLSPFQSSKSTVKHFKKSSNAALFYKTTKSKDNSQIPQMDLENLERPDFHQEFVDTGQEF